MNKRIKNTWTKGLITWEEAEAMDRQLDKTNKAIYKVLTTQYKKDALDAHKEVKDAGFKVEKWGSEWRISSKYRTIYISYFGWRNCRIHLGNFTDSMTLEQVSKIDFVNLLTKPVNKEYYRPCIDPIHEKYEQIQCDLNENKWRVDYYGEQIRDTMKRIEEYQKKIMSLQEDLVDYSKRKTECTCWLDNYKNTKKGA